jgi:fructose-1,6-bisphosphatase/sedoheptulose 1,7-bisphosphatase-like protein
MFDLLLEMLRVVEDAAIASARTMGMGNAKAAPRNWRPAAPWYSPPAA